MLIQASRNQRHILYHIPAHVAIPLPSNLPRLRRCASHRLEIKSVAEFLEKLFSATRQIGTANKGKLLRNVNELLVDGFKINQAQAWRAVRLDLNLDVGGLVERRGSVDKGVEERLEFGVDGGVEGGVFAFPHGVIGTDDG